MKYSIENKIISSIIEENKDNQCICLEKHNDIALYEIKKIKGNGIPCYGYDTYFLIFTKNNFVRINDYQQALKSYKNKIE